MKNSVLLITSSFLQVVYILFYILFSSTSPVLAAENKREIPSIYREFCEVYVPLYDKMIERNKTLYPEYANAMVNPFQSVDRCIQQSFQTEREVFSECLQKGTPQAECAKKAKLVRQMYEKMLTYEGCKGIFGFACGFLKMATSQLEKALNSAEKAEDKEFLMKQIAETEKQWEQCGKGIEEFCSELKGMGKETFAIQGEFEGVCADGLSEVTFDLINYENCRRYGITIEPSNKKEKLRGTITKNIDPGTSNNTQVTFRPDETGPEKNYLNPQKVDVIGRCYPFIDKDSDMKKVRQTVTIEQPPLFFVHGINDSDEECWPALKPRVARAGWNLSSVDYHDEKPIQTGSTEMAGALVNFIDLVKKGTAQHFGKRKIMLTKVDIIAHSMGGLVTRWYIGDTKYEFNIRKLIMVGTPNRGAPAVDCTFWFNSFKHWPSTQQLRPRSHFLNDLKTRPMRKRQDDRKNGVEYYAIAGTDWTTPITKTHSHVGLGIMRTGNEYIFRGDGVVPVTSARIPGVPLYCTYDAHGTKIARYMDPGRLAEAYVENAKDRARGYTLVDSDAVYTILSDLILKGTSQRGEDCAGSGEGRHATTTTIESPVTLHAFDEHGNHAGINARGLVENQIGEGVYYYGSSVFGHETIKNLTDKKLKFVAVGEERGDFSLVHLEFNPNGEAEEYVFKDIQTNTDTQHRLDTTRATLEIKPEKRTIITKRKPEIKPKVKISKRPDQGRQPPDRKPKTSLPSARLETEAGRYYMTPTNTVSVTTDEYHVKPATNDWSYKSGEWTGNRKETYGSLIGFNIPALREVKKGILHLKLQAFNHKRIKGGKCSASKKFTIKKINETWNEHFADYHTIKRLQKSGKVIARFEITPSNKIGEYIRIPLPLDELRPYGFTIDQADTGLCRVSFYGAHTKRASDRPYITLVSDRGQSQRPVKKRSKHKDSKSFSMGFTLDFETGNLTGWTKTGTVFDYQPTLGDNPTARRRGQSSKHQGKYWIGGFEKYQGKPGQKSGSIQGDKPQGTLTSPPFTIPNGTLNFLIGGGNSFKTRVELIVSGKRVLHATGRNTETMHRVEWDLSPYSGKTGRIRIVDNSSGGWGHINVDDFRFNSHNQDDRRISSDSDTIRDTGFTLDFETGNLTGWTKTGTVFDYQPTLGDNPTARRRGQSSKHQGKYWIGGFEKYQGKPGQKSGSIQGDKPQGTLTSPPFTIPNGTLNFLIGGGNNFQTRVELIVSGKRVLHATGRNTETMHRVVWDLSTYAGKTGRIRIVDNTSGGWGHINVDDFRLND